MTDSAGLGVFWVPHHSSLLAGTGCIICGVRCRVKVQGSLFKDHQGFQDGNSRAFHRVGGPSASEARHRLDTPWRWLCCLLPCATVWETERLRERERGRMGKLKEEHSISLHASGRLNFSDVGGVGCRECFRSQRGKEVSGATTRPPVWLVQVIVGRYTIFSN